MTSNNIYSRKSIFRLRVIFVYYCSFANRDNCCLLKSCSFWKMLQHINVKCKIADSDILFCATAGKQKYMKFEQFLQSLDKIAHIQYPKVNQQKAIELLLKDSLWPLYEHIRHRSSFSQCLKAINKDVYNEANFSCLQKVKTGLMQLYGYYFLGNNLPKSRQQIVKVTFKLQHELQLTPYTVNKPNTYLWIMYLLQQQSQSAYVIMFPTQTHQQQSEFNFFKFIKFLISCAQMLDGNYCLNVHRILNLLQLIHISKGFKQIRKTVPQINLLSYSEDFGYAVSKGMEIQNSKAELMKTYIRLCNQGQCFLKMEMSKGKLKEMIDKICQDIEAYSQTFLKVTNRVDLQDFIKIIIEMSQKYNMTIHNITHQLKKLLTTSKASLGTNIGTNNLGTTNQISNAEEQYLKLLYEQHSQENTMTLSMYYGFLIEYLICPLYISHEQAVDSFLQHCQNIHNNELIIYYETFLVCLLGVAAHMQQNTHKSQMTQLIDVIRHNSKKQSPKQIRSLEMGDMSLTNDGQYRMYKIQQFISEMCQRQILINRVMNYTKILQSSSKCKGDMQLFNDLLIINVIVPQLSKFVLYALLKELKPHRHSKDQHQHFSISKILRILQQVEQPSELLKDFLISAGYSLNSKQQNNNPNSKQIKP